MKNRCIFIIILFLFFPGFVLADERVDGIVEVAYAYYNKGPEFQYDNYNMNVVNLLKGGTLKVQGPVSPEDASSQNTIYLNCSDYVWNVYKEAINYEIISPYSKSITANMIQIQDESRVYYHEITEETNISEESAKIKSTLQAGDIIVMRRTDGNGHAMLYVKDNFILHSVGGTYNYTTKKDSVEENGTVVKQNVEDLFTETNSHYLFKDNVTKIAILRPLNVASSEEYPLTENTKARLELSSLVIDKTFSISSFISLNLGEEFVTEIKLENKSNEERTFVVKEEISDVLSYRSNVGNGVYSNGTITWNITLSPDETTTVSYVSVVIEDKGNIGKIVNSKTTVGNIVFEKLVGNGNIQRHLTTEEEKLLLVGLNEVTASTTNEAISNLYKQTLGMDINLLTSEEIIHLLLEQKEIDNIGVYYFKKLQNDEVFNRYQNMLVSNLYAGRYLLSETEEEKATRTRVTDDSTLSIGDILIVGDLENQLYEMYLYTEDSLIYWEDGVKNSITSEDMTNKLTSLLGESIYFVLRPAQEYLDFSYIKEVVQDETTLDMSEQVENPKTGSMVVSIVFLILIVSCGVILYVHHREVKKN